MNIHKAPNPAMVRASLYFGANIPGHSDVVDKASFDAFLADYVTPAFPGFTVTTAEGYWKGQPETVRVLTILSTDTDALRQQIRQIAERYKTQFGQEAVAYEFVAAEFTLDCWPYGPVKAYHKEGKGY